MRSTKHNNNKTFSTRIVIQTMSGISLTNAQSNILITSSMAPSLTGVPGKTQLFGLVPTMRHEKCIQV